MLISKNTVWTVVSIATALTVAIQPAFAGRSGGGSRSSFGGGSRSSSWGSSRSSYSAPRSYSRPSYSRPSYSRPSVSPNVSRPSYSSPGYSRPSVSPNVSRPSVSPYVSRPSTITNNRPTGGYARTPRAGGGFVEDRGNHQVHYRADGTRERVVSASRTTVYRADGSRAQVIRGNTTVNYGRDGSTSVYRGGQLTYKQSRSVVNGSPIVQRTYYRNNTTVIHNYTSYSWGRSYVYAYHPAVVYTPVYYSWAFTPWYRPVTFTWGWSASPWYGYYGYYYRPYVTYTSPAYWLTDWLIADLLAETYNERIAAAQARAASAEASARTAEANARAAEADADRARATLEQSQANAQAAPITEEVKEQIKAQVEQAMRAHQNQQPVTVTSLLNDVRHIYAVSDELEVTVQSTNENCSMTSGDLIRLANPVAEGDQAAAMTVVSSKKGSCAAGSVIMVSITDLQNFQNDFNERLENGMGRMKTEFHQQ